MSHICFMKTMKGKERGGCLHERSAKAMEEEKRGRPLFGQPPVHGGSYSNIRETNKRNCHRVSVFEPAAFPPFLWPI